MTASTWYVSTDGTGDFDSITDGFDRRRPGRLQSLVYPGVYVAEEPVEHLYLSDKPLCIAGLGVVPGETVLSGHEVSFFDCPGTVVENLLMTNSRGPISTGFTTSSVIRNCVFSDNDGTLFCAAVIGEGGWDRMAVEDCVFLNNTAPSICSEIGYGAALHLEHQAADVRRCIFIGNTTSGAGAGAGIIASRYESYIEDCLFVENVAGDGAAVSTPGETGAPVRIERCTFWENRSTTGGSAIYMMTDDWTMRHSIIAGTINGWGLVAPGSGDARCCDWWMNERGNHAGGCYTCVPEYGNIYVDPVFCDAEAGDFGLQPWSPCLPGVHGGYACLRIGAFDVGCAVSSMDDPEIADEGVELDATRYRDGIGLAAGPNPTFGPLQLSVSVTEPTRVQVAIFDVSGRSVMDVAEEDLSPGTHRYQLDDVSQLGAARHGVYYAVVRSGNRHVSQAFVVLTR
ncbi:MAG: right-handed parallel beta-helix repeat-containing protein [Candidatus Eisenbacteria bacterium]